MSKKIVILNGSPRKNGNTSALIKAFTEGAESAGNTVTEFFWTVWTFMAVKDASAGTAAKNVPASRRTIWTKFTRQ